MLIYFTDAVTKQQVAINPNYVCCVFVAQEGELKGQTVIALTSGTVIVEQSQIDVVGAIQGQIK
jgi:hypothetical protein